MDNRKEAGPLGRYEQISLIQAIRTMSNDNNNINTKTDKIKFVYCHKGRERRRRRRSTRVYTMAVNWWKKAC